MRFPTRFSLLSLIGLSLSHRGLSFTPSFPYGTETVRGVNLGGWLVLEPWITPSIFDATGNSAIIDEWTFCQYQDPGTAASALKNHWDTWITEGDIAAIAGAGLNHIRIPIGYWAFDVDAGEPYIQGQLPYLQQAVQWAANHGLKVVVDLHGAPGSQNGFDNSGHRVSYPGWQSNPSNIQRTNAIIRTIAQMFDQDNVVPIIAALNEPAGYDSDVLSAAKKYWISSYQAIRYPFGAPSNTVQLIHDAFQPLGYWQGWQTSSAYQGVAMDTHIYQVFTEPTIGLSRQGHLSAACGTQNSLSNFDIWIFVGEWTLAITDCAKYLNGRGVGARYDGSYPGSTYIGSCGGMTGSGSSFSSDYKSYLRQFWEAQVISYEKGDGWLFWTWKAENADEWSYQAGLNYGWIPSDPTDLQYPDICG